MNIPKLTKHRRAHDSVRPPPARARVFVGDYFASARRLYRIEHIAGSRAIIEDCGSGHLIDMGIDELSRLQLVKPRKVASEMQPPLPPSFTDVRGN